MMLKRFVTVYAFCFASIACGSSPEPLGEVGVACVENVECESDLCLTEFRDTQEVLDGMCTNECTFAEPESCAPGTVCLRYNATTEHYCFVECTGDCRDGWSCQCIDFGCSIRACVPPLK